MSAIAIIGLITTAVGVATDNDIVTAIGLTAVAVPAMISGGLAVAAAGTLATVVGILTILAGVGTATFASAEYQQSFTGNNWILDSGMSEGWYNGLMLTTATVATLGTMASCSIYALKIKTILEIGRISGVRANPGFPGIRFRNTKGLIKSLELQWGHGHGLHLQINTWWLKKKGYEGLFYRAFGKHFEIFKFWKGWY